MEQNAHTRRGVHNEAPPLCSNCPARSTMIGSRCAGQGAVHIRRHSAGAACDGAVNKLSAARGERLARKRAVSGNRTSRFVVPRVYIRVIRLSTRSSTTHAQAVAVSARVIFVIAETAPEGLRSRAVDRPCREARRSTPTTTTTSCV